MSGGWHAKLASLLLACSVSLSAYSEPAKQLTSFEIPRAAAQWKKAWLKAAREVWGLRVPSATAAQIGQESGWRDGLTSRVGAKGLCQFMEATARGLELQTPGLSGLQRYSPAWCFKAQAVLMKQLYERYHDVRDDCEAMKFALSSYNGGIVMLHREIGQCHNNPDGCDHRKWDEVAVKNARANWAWKENRTYVFRIMQRSPFYAIEGWGAMVCPVPAHLADRFPKAPAPEPVPPHPLEIAKK